MEILQPYDAAANGLTMGTRLLVPPGMSGVVMKDGRALDILPPGDHSLEPSLLPLLVQKLKLRPGPTGGDPLPAAVFLVQTAASFALPWRCSAILSKSAAYGLTYTMLAGQASVQIADPGRFCTALLNAGDKIPSSASATLDQSAAYFLRLNLQGQISAAIQALKLPPEQALSARESLRAAAGQAAAAGLAVIGVHCTAFDLDTVGEPNRTPCAHCGSATVPTGYGLFQRNISLFYVRLTARKEGNFCVPCALKLASAFNAAMLVIGWWGLIGLVLTPVYFAMNLYSLTRILTGAKAVPRPAQIVNQPVEVEGSLPPPPAVS